MHTKPLNCITKLLELSSQRLLKAIKSLAKAANLTLLPLSNKSGRLLHVHFLVKITVKKRILHIQLK